MHGDSEKELNIANPWVRAPDPCAVENPHITLATPKT